MDLTIASGLLALGMLIGAFLYNKKLIWECNNLRREKSDLQDRNYKLKAYANGLCRANNEMHDEVFKQGFEEGKQAKIRSVGIAMLSDSYVLQNGSFSLSPEENFYRPAKLGPKK